MAVKFLTLKNVGWLDSKETQPERLSTFGNPIKDMLVIRNSFARFGWMKTGATVECVEVAKDWRGAKVPSKLVDRYAALLAEMESMESIPLYHGDDDKVVSASGKDVAKFIREAIGQPVDYAPTHRGIVGNRRAAQIFVALYAYAHNHNLLQRPADAVKAFVVPCEVVSVKDEDDEKSIQAAENNTLGKRDYDAAGNAQRYYRAWLSHPEWALTRLSTFLNIDRNKGLLVDAFIRVHDRMTQLDLLNRASASIEYTGQGKERKPVYVKGGGFNLGVTKYPQWRTLLGGDSTPGMQGRGGAPDAIAKEAFENVNGSYNLGDVATPAVVEEFVRLTMEGARPTQPIPASKVKEVLAEAKARDKDSVAVAIMSAIVEGRTADLVAMFRGNAPTATEKPASVKAQPARAGKKGKKK